MHSLSTLAATATFFFLLSGSPGALLASGIYDNAELFSDEVEREVLDKLNRIEKESGHETIIESIARVPRTEFTSQADKDRYFQELLLSTARARKADGAFVLICKTPGRVQIDFHRSLHVSSRDRDRIRDAVLPYFKAKDFDAGLQSLSDGIASQLRPTVQAEANVPETTDGAISKVVDRRPATPITPSPKFAPYNASDRGFSLTSFFFIILAAVGVGCFIVWRYIRNGGSGGYAFHRDPGSTNQDETTPSSSHRKFRGASNRQTSGIDPLTAGMLGYTLGGSSSSHSSPTPSPAPDPTPSSSFDFGSSSSGSSGGGFSGGSGGDF